jgi:hypothetical protein
MIENEIDQRISKFILLNSVLTGFKRIIGGSFVSNFNSVKCTLVAINVVLSWNK